MVFLQVMFLQVMAGGAGGISTGDGGVSTGDVSAGGVSTGDGRCGVSTGDGRWCFYR